MDTARKYPIRRKQLEFVSDHCFPNIIIIIIIIIICVIINLSNMQTGFKSSLRISLFFLVLSALLLCYNLLLFPPFLLLLSFLFPVGLYYYLGVSSHFTITF